MDNNNCNSDMVAYLQNLKELVKSGNNIELSKHVKQFQNVILKFKSDIRDEKFRYFVVENLISLISIFYHSDSYNSLFDDFATLKSDLKDEKNYLQFMHEYSKMMLKYNIFDDIDVFYISILAISNIHNNRVLYNNYVVDKFKNEYKGITYIPSSDTTLNNDELKDEVESTMKFLIKRFEQ